MAREFGEILRELRYGSGVGIKTLAPELGISYSYLSKLENNQMRPSEGMVRRIAKHFGYDEDALLLASERVPDEIIRILREHPEEALKVLRLHFGARSD